MSRKMSGKGAVTPDFDLSQFVTDADPVSETAPAGVEPVKASPKSKAKPKKSPKPSAEMLDVSLTIRLTKRDMEKLKEQAGLASVSVYLRHVLKQKGIL